LTTFVPWRLSQFSDELKFAEINGTRGLYQLQRLAAGYGACVRPDVNKEGPKMRQGLLFVATTCLLATTVSATGEADPDEAKLKGTWVIVASEQAGSKDDNLKGYKFTFAGGKLATDANGEKGKESTLSILARSRKSLI
jgi:hypothetical protein